MTVPALGDPHDMISLMHEVSHLMRVAADRRARCHGSTRAQWFILLRLSKQAGLSQKELADQLEVEPITIARLVDRLEQNGLVERRADGQDRRVWRLHLLPAAHDILGEIHMQIDGLCRELLAGVPEAARAAMAAALRRMKANLLNLQDIQPAEAVEQDLESA